MSSTFFNGYKVNSFIILLMSQKGAGQQGVRLFKHIGSSRSWCINTFIALSSALSIYVFDASPFNSTYVKVPELRIPMLGKCITQSRCSNCIYVRKYIPDI